MKKILVFTLLLSLGRLFLFNEAALAAARRRQQNLDSTDDFSPSRLLLESEDPSSQPLPAASSIVAGQPVQCEPIDVKLCAQMPYKLTRMPNFFGDSNQLEAGERALQYSDLVSSQCSPGVFAYICELLTPVCLEENQREAMKRFDIYPCRSWCRKVRRDCDRQLDQLSQLLFKGSAMLPPGFICDQLPFESNGGNGTLQGPCHDASDLAQQPAKQSNYSPYNQYLDTNNPPYITDTSKIDSKYVRPAQIDDSSKFYPPLDNYLMGPNSDDKPDIINRQQTNVSQTKLATTNVTGQQQQTFAGALQNAAKTLIWALIRYSNMLSIATVILLLVALNSRRLSRLAKCGAAGSSKSSSASSSSSRHQLHRASGGQAGGAPGCPPLGGSHSPSSSSRSLMLFAGSGKQPASHQLLPATTETGRSLEPSQKLLQALNQTNSTIINPHLPPMSGTLGRYACLPPDCPNAAATAGRLQPLDHKHFMSTSRQHAPVSQSNTPFDERQQLFSEATLDSQSSHSNQYDYIQLPKQQQQQQPRQTPAQLYSNILLSSPSHQVLLFNGQHASTGQSSPARPTFHRSPNSRGHAHHAPYFTSGAISPYAPASTSNSSSGGGGGSGSYLVAEHQRSLQRRHRRHQLVLDSPLSSGSSGSAGSGQLRRPM